MSKERSEESLKSWFNIGKRKCSLSPLVRSFLRGIIRDAKVRQEIRKGIEKDLELYRDLSDGEFYVEVLPHLSDHNLKFMCASKLLSSQEEIKKARKRAKEKGLI